MDSIEPISICLATGSEVISDSMCTIPMIFCDVGGHAIKQHGPCQIIKNLQYNVILDIGWLKSTNPVIDWVACSLDLTIGAQLHIVLALLVKSLDNIYLQSLKLVLAEVKRGCPI